MVQECLQPERDQLPATLPMDMRAGTDTAARVVAVLVAAGPHSASLFANRRANRVKGLMHDGVGIWLAARRLNQDTFHWPGICHGLAVELDAGQPQVLVKGDLAEHLLRIRG